MNQLQPNSGNVYDNVEVNNTFKLLKEGEAKIKLSEQHKNITLFLGNTGAGKSTFFQWILGDNSRLISKEEGEEEFIIEDENRISSSTINSKTIFPELAVDNKTNTAFYDCPGFSDTRSTSHDIATTYFIKTLTDYASSVKIVLVVSYPSVRKGVDRQDFMKLMRHATDLIKNVEKFSRSIAIIVTKVDNMYSKRGKLVSDEKTIAKIANFLQGVKQDLEDKLRQVDIPHQEQIFCESIINLVNTLLEKDNENYARIGIFRRPDEAGVVSNIALLQEGKAPVKRMIYEKLEFTVRNIDDFGYTISERSKNDINSLVEIINDKVWFDLTEIIDKIKQYYSNLINQIDNKIDSFINSEEIVFARETEAHIFSSQLDKGYYIISDLLNEVKNLSDIKELAIKIKNSTTHLGIDNCVDNIENISVQGKYFNFLQIVSSRKLNIKPFASLLQPVETYFFDSKQNIEKKIFNAEDKINHRIYHHIENIAIEIEDYYRKKMETLEIERLPSVLNQGYHVLISLTKEIKNLDDALEFFEKLSDGMISLDITTAKLIENTLNIKNYVKYLKFLKVLNNGILQARSVEWMTSFNKIVNHLSESEKWYKFLLNLYAKFSEYEIQKDTNRYNVANIEDWGQSGQSQGIEIAEDNFQFFLEKIEQFNITEYDSVKNIKITALQLKSLNHVLSLTLRNKIDTLCSEPGKLVIKGDYVKFSDLINSDGKIANLCKNGVSLNSVDIFALNTVFIDKDFQGIGDKLQFSVVAPKWKIIEDRKINLDGAPGVINHPRKASDGSCVGCKGSDGMPGLPGGAAGNFLGIGQEFIDIKNLTITANGGQGGPGQDGGNGAEGNRGKHATINDEFEHEFIRDDKFIPEFIPVLTNVVTEQYKYYGKPGGAGGNGGQGGRGGFAGIEGKIRVINLNVFLDFLITKNDQGYEGIAGKGGRGGIGGMAGNNLLANYCKIRSLVTLYIPVGKWCGQESLSPTNIYLQQVFLTLGRAASGLNGADGYNALKIKNPEKRTAFQSIDDILIRYKSYLRENLRNHFKSHSLMKFVKQLDSTPDIRESYNTLGLVNELQSLEKQVYRLQGLDKKNIIYFYQSILNRVIKYSQQLRRDENFNQYKKVLGYLYTATLSKIYNMKVNADPNLIIDVKQYLTLVKQDINTLRNLQEKNNKAIVVNRFKDSYKLSVDKRIVEANKFIEVQIIPEIDSINIQIDDKIDLLINETLFLQKQAREEKKELIQKKRELENALIASWLFNGLKIAGQMIGCFGNLGSSIASIVESGSQIAESLVLDDHIDQHTTVKLPDGVISSIHSGIAKIKEFKIDHFNKVLEYIYHEINKYPENFNDISEKVEDIKIRYEAVKNNSGFGKVKELESELKRELIRKEIELKNQEINTADEENIGAAELIVKFNQVIQLGTVGFAIYSKYKSDQKKIKVIDDAIEQTKSKIQKLEQYEEQIYEIIIPVLNNLEDNFTYIASQLETKSPVVLDVTQWQVQNALKDIKLQMKQFTKGFTVEDNLERCIEKLEEAMTTLINVYDRIQNYQQQKQLADYLADIGSANANHINITDSGLAKAVSDLEIVIRSNLVLERYKTVVNALKQSVFPLAHFYLDEPVLPSQLELENNFENLADKAMERVETIQLKIKEYDSSIIEHDCHINKGWFNSHYQSAKPFFVWENKKHSNMISNLLLGKKVVVKSNLLNSSLDKDSIKFNIIGLNFYSSNDTISLGIYNTLKGFTVNATHLGNSYYRYGNKIYVITTSSQNIQFSFEKDTHGEPIHKNRVYNKIKSGDLMLSPYAMWEFQLINATNEDSFFKLEAYKDTVNLELVGYGSYLAKGTNIPNVENYYKANEAIFLINSNHLDDLQRENITQAYDLLQSLKEVPLQKPIHRHRHQRELPSAEPLASGASQNKPWTSKLLKQVVTLLGRVNGEWPSLFSRENRISQKPAILNSGYPTPQSLPAVGEYTVGHLQGGLQLMDLVVRTITGERYPHSVAPSDPLAESEARLRAGLQQWAEISSPDSLAANPDRGHRVDRLSTPWTAIPINRD